MKYIITEDQLEKVTNKMLNLTFSAFGNDWNVLQKFIEKRNHPLYILTGNLDLSGKNDIETLGSLFQVRGDLDLNNSSIKSLGKLNYVVGYLNLQSTPIESIGNLTYVGDDLYLRYTPISINSDLNTKKDISNQVLVLGQIYL